METTIAYWGLKGHTRKCTTKGCHWGSMARGADVGGLGFRGFGV